MMCSIVKGDRLVHMAKDKVKFRTKDQPVHPLPRQLVAAENVITE